MTQAVNHRALIKILRLSRKFLVAAERFARTCLQRTLFPNRRLRRRIRNDGGAVGLGKGDVATIPSSRLTAQRCRSGGFVGLVDIRFSALSGASVRAGAAPA